MSNSLTQFEVLEQSGKPAILQVDPENDALGWAKEYKDQLRATVGQYGAVMVRGLGLNDASQTGDVLRALGSDLMTEREAFATREVHSNNIYSSSAWPQNQQMCMHHELSYAREFPGLMMFACLTAPAAGGATAIADATAILKALPEDMVKKFDEHGWMLTRSYTEDIGISIEDAFGTDDRSDIESYCQANGIECEWQSDGGLHTSQRRRAVVEHPRTAQRCWFNQIAFLNEWTLEPEIREFLVDVYGDDGLPFNTRFGNGDPLSEGDVQAINAVYTEHTMREPWQSGDLLLVDNIRMAHARESFEGTREVIVAMSDPTRLKD